jgi:hypothetical protein
MKESFLGGKVRHNREGGYPGYLIIMDSRLHGKDDKYQEADFQ